MLSLTACSLGNFRHRRFTSGLNLSLALGLISLIALFAQSAQAASFVLQGDPGFSFGTASPNTGLMAAAIQARMGIPISVVTSLSDENTAFAPLLANSKAAPSYVFGPAAFGVIKNLNLNSAIVTGLTSGELRSAGFEVTPCGDFAERFVLRVFSARVFYDVLVRPVSCSGIANVGWSFYQVSGPRRIVSPTPTPAPTP